MKKLLCLSIFLFVACGIVPKEFKLAEVVCNSIGADVAIVDGGCRFDDSVAFTCLSDNSKWVQFTITYSENYNLPQND